MLKIVSLVSTVFVAVSAFAQPLDVTPVASPIEPVPAVVASPVPPVVTPLAPAKNVPVKHKKHKKSHHRPKHKHHHKAAAHK